MPLNMDPLLAVWKPCKRLPFEDTPSPELYTLVFCQLWGDCAGGVDGREDMRNDVDLGCGAISTARARSDGTTFSRGAPSGPENSSEEALQEGGDIHDSGGLDGREDMRNDMQLGCAAVSTAKARSGGTIVRGAPSGPEISTKEALPDGGYLQEGGNEEPV
jgi:hypothetical protein